MTATWSHKDKPASVKNLKEQRLDDISPMEPPEFTALGLVGDSLDVRLLPGWGSGLQPDL